jgi:hypothetical protein
MSGMSGMSGISGMGGLNRSARSTSRPSRPSRPPAFLPLLALLCAAPAWAAQGAPPMITDRPDQTESAQLVPRGLFQLEAGGLHAFDRDGADPALRHSNVGGALLRIGVADPVELRLGFAGWERASVEGGSAASGFGDLAVGTKVRMANGAGLSPAIAVIGGILIPVGDRDFRAAGVDPSVRVSVAHELGGGFGLGYNAGASWTTVTDVAGDESVETALLYTVALGRELLPRLAGFVEVFGVHGLAGGAGSWLALDGGVTVPIRVNLQLDLSGGVGLSEGAADWFVSAGVAVRVPR